ncbi:hypothetical protein [Hyalangium versicolor]|uniref:hypothetical protein n=1 Tax=Hyalangium versicolor TaxID=2861190 RepID=UPI001CC9B57D|nr:hypothetical protein [Hyalangium versicolor]
MNPQPLRRWLWSAALALLAACSSDEPTTPPPPSETPGFTLALSTDKTPILQGSNVTVTATVTRETGFDGAVDLTLADLPSGVSVTPASIASSATSATIQLAAAATAPHSLPTTVTVKGTSGDKTASKQLTVTVRGPPGSLDTSLVTGPVITPVGAGEDYAEGIAVQPDGKILLVGRTAASQGTTFAVVRYSRDGSLDTGFGTGGKVTTAVGTPNSQAFAVALQTDGKILVAGTADGGASGIDFALVRYNADGSLDTSFGNGGKVTTAFGNGADSAYALLLQSDGKILLGGDTDAGATGLDFALARYNSNGSLDTGFGTGGKVTTSIKSAAGRDTIFSLALETVGSEARIVAAGGDGDFILARYTPAGALDTGFGTGGKINGLFTTSIGSARAVAVTSDGKLVVAGHSNHDFALVRLSDAGTLDTGFGTGGKVITQVSTTNWDEATALVIQADGKLVVGGWMYTGSGSSGDFALLRYESTGVLDSGFGTGGKVVTPLASGIKDDTARAVALQADERVPVVRILLAGSASDSNHDFALARFWP